MRMLLLLSLLVVSCGTTEDEPIVVDVQVDEPDASSSDVVVDPPTGAELYESNCATCHGPEASGGETWRGSIRGLRDIGPIVQQGRGTMEAVPLSDDEVARVQEYLDSFGVVQSELTGREIFTNRCGTCHGDRGEGTALSFPIQFMHPEFSSWIVRNGRATSRFAGPMPSYSSDEISDDQLAEMQDFMWAQPLPGGGEGIYTAFCGNCHGAGGFGGYSGHLAIGRDPSQIVRSGHGGTDFGDRHNYMPSWTTSQLTDVQLNAIRAYLLNL